MNYTGCVLVRGQWRAVPAIARMGPLGFPTRELLKSRHGAIGRARDGPSSPPTANLRAADRQRVNSLLALSSSPVNMFSALATLVLGGICTDKHPDCGNWGQKNECVNNADFMALHCPLTCKVCEFECAETNTNCAAWARAGQCAENPLMMLRECPIHCGVCFPECRDTKYQCAAWAEAGGCAENPTWMTLYCPKSCGTCVDACRDKSPKCTDWVMEGECGSNAQFMAHTCPASCGICGEGINHNLECKDHNTTQCHLWHDLAECERNPQAVVKDCPFSCGACTTVCMDQDEQCRGWAAAGHCEASATEHHAFMLSKCPAICSVCSSIDENFGVAAAREAPALK